MLELFTKLADDVTKTAEGPAEEKLLDAFRKVEKEILEVLEKDPDLFTCSGDADLVEAHEEDVKRSDAQPAPSGIGRHQIGPRTDAFLTSGDEERSWRERSMRSEGHATAPAPPPRQGTDYPMTILRRVDDLGLLSYDLCGPPSRLWADRDDAPNFVFTNVHSARVQHVPTPAQALRSTQDQETWAPAFSGIARTPLGLFPLGEDPQRRLDAREVSTLAH